MRVFNEKIKPSLVLTLICLITCALLVIAYEATYTDSTGVMTEQLISGLNEIYGSSDSFAMAKNSDGTLFAPEGVTCVLENGNAGRAYEITTDGYSSGGLHVLVGLDTAGNVSGVSILSIGETPGLGTRVQSPDFLAQFKGQSYGTMIHGEAPAPEKPSGYAWWDGDPETMYYLEQMNSQSSSGGFELDAVTGATFSSKGMNRAVETALKADMEYLSSKSSPAEETAAEETQPGETAPEEGAEEQ